LIEVITMPGLAWAVKTLVLTQLLFAQILFRSGEPLVAGLRDSNTTGLSCGLLCFEATGGRACGFSQKA